MKYFLSISMLFLFFGLCYGQKKQSPDYNYIITSKKVVMKHNNETGVLIIPLVSAKYPALRKALCDTCLFFGDSLVDVINDYQLEGSGITSFSYELTFASNDIVSLKLFYETMGAYPSESQRLLTLDIHTGKHYYLNNEIDPKGLKWVFSMYKTTLRKRISNDKQDSDCSNAYHEIKKAINDLKIEELFKEYIFTKKGVVVSMEKMLPHLIEECEPNRKLLIPYNKLRPFKTSTAVVIK